MKEATTTKKAITSFVCALTFMTAPTVMAKEYHETWCGEKVTTVDKEAFEDQGEADDYYELLDIIFCGSTKPA